MTHRSTVFSVLRALFLTRQPRLNPNKNCFLIALMALSLFFSGNSGLFAACPVGTEAETKQLTNDLIKGAKEHRTARAERKKAIQASLKTVAEKRKDLMVARLTEPTEFLNCALPPSAIKKMPPDVQPSVEQYVDVQGTIEVVIDEDFKETSAVSFFLETSDPVTKQSKRRKIHFASEPENLKTGAKVRGKGYQLGEEVVVGELLKENSVEEKGLTTLQLIDEEAALVTGAQNVATILVNFTDTNASCASTDMNSLMYTAATSVDDFYQVSSFNNISINGQVFGPFTVPFSSSTCSYQDWRSAAESAARAAGVNLDQFNRRLFIVPSNVCDWAGIASVGGNWAFVQGSSCRSRNVIAHELGHNLGMFHASAGDSEYGDRSDVMGSSSNQLNSAHMTQTGWTPADDIQTVTQSGSYTVGMLEEQGDALRVLRIAKPDTNENYYLGYRRTVKYDSNLNSTYSNKVNIHRWDGRRNTFFLSALSDGMSFEDSANGIKVTQVTHDDVNAVVQVEIPGSTPCQKVSPSINVTPLTLSGEQGDSLRYNVQINNQNPSACSPTAYGLNVTGLQTGWLQNKTPSTLTLASGATGTIELDIISADQSQNGDYVVNVSAFDVANTLLSDAQNITYTVIGTPDPNQAPTAVLEASPLTVAAGETVSFIGVNSLDPDGSIATYTWDFGDDTTATGANVEHEYAADGSYVVTLTVTDNEGLNDSEQVTITVSTPDTNENPESVINAPDAGKVNAAILFKGEESTDSDGTIDGYLWNFGDGETSTEQNPSHTYSEVGTFKVTLTVTDDKGATGASEINIIITAADPVNQPPVAGFTFDASGLSVAFTDTSTDDGTIASRSWSFGDGQTSTDQNATHFYAAAGTYTVTLTLTDNEGLTDSEEKSVILVTIPPPLNENPESVINAPDAGKVNVAILFKGDESTDSDGTVDGYLWNFGDGTTSTEQNPSHTYSAAGVFTVTLTVTDNQGATDTSDVDIAISEAAPVNQPPVAGFTFEATQLSVVFTDASTDADGTIASRSWTFGDDATSTDQNPTHVYAAAGTYTVTLTVTDNGGLTDSEEKTVTVSGSVPDNQSPVSVIDAPDAAETTGPIVFKGEGSTDSDGTINDYLWDFGDGETSTEQNPSHTFTAPGVYTVKLTVTDDKGATGESETTVTVTGDPVNQNPVAAFTFEADQLSVTFTDASTDEDGTIESRSWDFGDDETSSEANPVHAYAAAGTYTVELTVTDDSGNTNSVSKSVTVQNGDVQPQSIWIEAEQGFVIRPMKVVSDETASGGKYIRDAGHRRGRYFRGYAGYAIYKVTVPEDGVYTLWGRVSGGKESTNALHVRFDREDKKEWNIPTSTDWQWNSNQTYTLTAGTHRLIIRSSANGVKLDKLLLTSDPAFTPTGLGESQESSKK